MYLKHYVNAHQWDWEHLRNFPPSLSFQMDTRKLGSFLNILMLKFLSYNCLTSIPNRLLISHGLLFFFNTFILTLRLKIRLPLIFLQCSNRLFRYYFWYLLDNSKVVQGCILDFFRIFFWFYTRKCNVDRIW